MKTTAIVNQKGGTGKTTTAINLGRGLALRDKKVLLIDLDAQGNLGYSLGITEVGKSMSEVLMGESGIDHILVERESMDVAPSTTTLADVELSISNADDRVSILKDILKPLDGYDHIIIDCPPSLSLLTVNALNAADQVIIPMQLEVLSLQGLEQITNTIERVQQSYNNDLEILGILPVMVDRRRKLSAEIHNYINESYDYRIFQTNIRTNVRASEAPSFGQSVISYEPESNSAKDYIELANEILILNNN